MEFIQNNFGAGINSVVAETQIPSDAYYLLINARNRYGYLEPIKKHRLLNLNVAKVQGSIGVGNTLIVFGDGKAFYKIPSTDTFVQIQSFLMSPTADILWAEKVPASTMNLRRTIVDIANAKNVQYSASLFYQGTPQAIVVQDGINQPFLILQDEYGNFSARVSHKFDQWKLNGTDQNDNEYVPVGREMMYKDGILYIIDPTRKFMYRSVTGRPLDFVINVDNNGNKPTNEVDANLTIAFDFDDITCLAPLTTPNMFLYGTRNTVRMITADLTNTLFGEPTYYVSSIIDAGIVGFDCTADILGDLAFIDEEGVISFDAVKNLRYNGRNSIFSLPLSRFLKERTQTDMSCACVYDNYAFFSLSTTLGYGLAVYDIMRSCWVSIDLTDVWSVKQFAAIENADSSELYAVTNDNKVYQMFCEEDTYEAGLFTKHLAPGDTATEHKTQYLRCFFTNAQSDGKATVIEWVDGRASSRVEQPLKSVIGGIKYPVTAPIVPNILSTVDNPSYNMTKGLGGKKINFAIYWGNGARLYEIKFVSSEFTNNNSLKQKNNVASAIYG